MVRITCYDGVGCIGGNKILLEDGASRLFFDFGANFGAEGKYYEEFLKPKTCTGLHEFIQMGLLPPFTDLYREDLCSAVNCDPWRGIAPITVGEVGGVLVSHAHVDHMGAVHHLRTDIPIYCSTMTAAVSKALQDTGLSSAPNDYCYCVPRERDAETGLIASSNYRSSPSVGRQFHIESAPRSQEFAAFWAQSPNSRALDARECECSSTCAGLPVRMFPVDHSVFGACAWAVETSAGWVVYSGDLRFHGGYAAFSHEFAQAAAELEPIALIIEGTRIDSEDTRTEASVYDAALAEVQGCSGLVVADFGPRNVERLMTFLDIARECGRELLILPKDAYLLDAMASAGGPQTVPRIDSGGIRIYWEYSGKGGGKWRDAVREKHPGLGITPCEVGANQDKFICCLSFWDINELAYLQPVPGSIYMFSSCEAFDEEMEISWERLQAWIDRFSMRRVGKLLRCEKGADPLHVSGHASRQDLLQLVRTIRPKTLIPVHTTQPQVYSAEVSDVCTVRLPEKGVPIEV